MDELSLHSLSEESLACDNEVGPREGVLKRIQLPCFPPFRQGIGSGFMFLLPNKGNRAVQIASWEMSAAKQQRVLQGQLALAELQGRAVHTSPALPDAGCSNREAMQPSTG